MDEAIPRIRLVVGLGNPGSEYAGTRHNVGFAVVDSLAAQWGITWEHSKGWQVLWAKAPQAILVKPLSYMNRSGHPVQAVAQFYKIAAGEMLVVIDDMALEPGRLRLRPGGGTGGHNGLESIIVQFATEDIPRLRVGIGAAPRQGATDYVLGRFFEEEKPVIAKAVARGADAVKCAIDNGLLSAMNQFNKNPEPDRPEGGSTPKES